MPLSPIATAQLLASAFGALGVALPVALFGRHVWLEDLAVMAVVMLAAAKELWFDLRYSESRPGTVPFLEFLAYLAGAVAVRALLLI